MESAAKIIDRNIKTIKEVSDEVTSSDMDQGFVSLEKVPITCCDK